MRNIRHNIGAQLKLPVERKGCCNKREKDLYR